MVRQNTLHCYNSKMDHPELLPSNSALKPSKSALTHTMFLPPYSSNLEHPEIIKYFKGVYKLRLPNQKMTSVWDV